MFSSPLLPGLMDEMDQVHLGEPADPLPVRGPFSMEQMWRAMHLQPYDKGKEMFIEIATYAHWFFSSEDTKRAPTPPVGPTPQPLIKDGGSKPPSKNSGKPQAPPKPELKAKPPSSVAVTSEPSSGGSVTQQRSMMTGSSQAPQTVPPLATLTQPSLPAV